MQQYDANFLRALDNEKNKIVYARITSLQFNELPVETIEGKVISGSINIDGASAVRRSCSLSLTPQDINIHEYYWSKGIKFKLEVGINNSINSNYPDIIWFPQGIYVVTSFSTSLSAKDYTINIQGKDKMCLLNGDLGGTLNSSVDFGSIEIENDDNTTSIIKYPVKDIIREAVHQHGGEFFHNIIINDIDDLGVELLEYRYDDPMFLFRDITTSEAVDQYYNMTLKGDTPCWFNVTVEDILIAIERNGTLKNNYYQILMECNEDINVFFVQLDLETVQFTGQIAQLRLALQDYLEVTHMIISTIDDNVIVPDSLVSSLVGAFEPTPISLAMTQNSSGQWIPEENSELNLYLARINFGDTAGYATTDLTYPGDLILSAGDSLTKLLDSIKDMLGEFEYFYNLEGKFVFQRKKTYLSNTYSPLINNEDDSAYVENLVYTTQYSYIFNNGELITNFTNNPVLNNVKNDYTVWGTRLSAAGKEVPIHMRFAIDKKPIYYKTITITKEELEIYNTAYDFQQQPQIGQVYVAQGYKYLDTNAIEVDWRELIYQMAKDYRKYNHLDNFELKIIEANAERSLYATGKTGYEQYYIDMEGYWRYLYNPDIVLANAGSHSGIFAVDDLADFYLGEPKEDDGTTDFRDNPDNYFQVGSDHMYWAKNVYLNPVVLDFWIDFLEADGELEKFSNQLIGNRPKIANDSHVKSVYYKETPSIIFTSFEKFEKEVKKDGYRYFLASNLDDMFTRSAQGKSAKEAIDELLYNHSYCADNITLNTVPIYYLEPNTRIRLYNKETNIDGDYIISKITITLGAGKAMSISASKAPSRLL